MTDKADWLAGLQKGDPVVVHWIARIMRGDDKLQRIARVTKRRIVIDDGSWVRRVDGRREARCGCCYWQIEKPTATQARKANDDD